jgi:serine/threonine-protein kinase
VSRSCPQCSRTYEDKVFFCGHDGTVTVEDQDPADFDPRLGKQLGGYIVVARVADGAMGRVFEGRHPDTKERVAIKVLHDHVARDKVSSERFKREYEAASELNHPHVVKVLEFGQTPESSSFMTMEYLVGKELGGVSGKGAPLPNAQIVRVICQTALALDHAHSFGFIHRDLKPDNIFLRATDEGDDVRVLDFGSVKLQMETGAKLTAMGTTLGSPYYMSPEQATGSADVDQRSDVFALGAILHEMLTGKITFEAVNVALILMKIMNESPVAPSSRNPTITHAMDAVAEAALQKNKTNRYGTTLQLAEGVLKAYGLDPDVKKWASTPTRDIETALTNVNPASVPPRAPDAPAAVEPVVSRRTDSASPPSASSMTPAGVSKGLPRNALIGIAVAVVVLGALMLLR